MTPAGIVGVLISLAALGIAWSRMTTARLVLTVAMLIAHLVACVYYYLYSQTAASDSVTYYFDLLHYYYQPFSLGTVFVTKLVGFLKLTFGATYLDCFLIFQAIGFAGMTLLVRVFDEIEANVGVPDRRGYMALLFLPSVNFWTVAIGKDAPLFFAVSLCVWSILRFRKRFLYFCLSLGVMILFRAHIALMAATALAAAALFEPSISFGRKLGLLTVALLGVWATIGPVQQTLKVDVTSVSAVSTFVAENNNIYANVAGTTSIGKAPFLFKVISLLFRPFFFDAGGLMGLIASAENVGVVVAFIYVLMHWRDLAHLVRRVFFIRFALLFAFILLFSLSLLYYNVGLGLRQRVMAYPMMFSILVAMWSMRRRVAPPAPQSPRGAVVDGRAARPVPEA